MKLLVLTGLAVAMLQPGPPRRAIDPQTDAIFRAVLRHYASELKDSPAVCVRPTAPRTPFFPVRSGLVRPGFFPTIFEDPDFDRALRAVQAREDFHIAAASLPRKFRLDVRRCRDTLSFLAPAIVGDVAFVEATHLFTENGASGGTTDLIALRRTGPRWTIGSVKTVVYIN